MAEQRIHTDSASVYRCGCQEWDLDSDAVESMKNGGRFICDSCGRDIKEVRPDDEVTK